jgi:uncharacterized protein YjdB
MRSILASRRWTCTRLLLSCTVIASCGGGGGDTPTPPPPAPSVARLALSDTAVVLTVGRAVTLIADPLTATGTRVPGATVSWTSANPEIATISATGFLAAQAPGQTRVTATVGAVQASARVEVVAQRVASVIIVTGSPVLIPGDSITMAAQALDASGGTVTSTPLEWSVQDSSIASIDARGVLRARRGGVTTVRVRADTAICAWSSCNSCRWCRTIPVPCR